MWKCEGSVQSKALKWAYFNFKFGQTMNLARKNILGIDYKLMLYKASQRMLQDLQTLQASNDMDYIYRRNE